MPFSRSPSLADLRRRLKKLDQVFDIAKIRAEGLSAGEVVAYYEECSPAYRKHHSSEGSMHLAISPGRFRAEGFNEQLDRISASWPARPPGDVLELGFGQGFNLAYLAPKFPAVRFCGIDLTPNHAELTRTRLARVGANNVELAQGDFHALPWPDASFDHVYAIEAFCYARDLRQALSEVARVLRPGGTFHLFDGYLVRRPETFNTEEALGAELVAKGVALERFQLVDDIVEAGRALGLECRAVNSLDDEIAPNLKKLERLTGAVIRFPWLGRRALARRSPMRGRNVITGYLMRTTVALGVTVYREIVLQKSA